MIAGYKKKMAETETAQTLLAKDYKGMSNHGITVLVEYENDRKSESK